MNSIVFDVDDTILFTENRDYANSYPNEEVVKGIRRLKEKGWHITLMTARGMGRSNGDIETVREEVTSEIVKFCEKFDVPYDQLILGKPFSNYYVDDKALRPEEFVEKVDEMIAEFETPPTIWR